MASLTLKLPDTLKDQAEEAADEKGYQSTSEYARQALREKLETDLVTIRDGEEMISVEDAKEMLRKDAAVAKLESKVESDGIPEIWVPGETWKRILEEIHEEMFEEDLIPYDFSLRKIYEYTHERREQLGQKHWRDLGYLDIAKELVQDREFVFGGASKEDKQLRAKEYLQEEYPEFTKTVIENLGEKATEKAVRWLMVEGILSNSYQPQIERDEFEQRISEAFEFADFQSDEEGGDTE